MRISCQTRHIICFVINLIIYLIINRNIYIYIYIYILLFVYAQCHHQRQKTSKFDARMETRTGVLFGNSDRPQLHLILQALIHQQPQGGPAQARPSLFFFCCFIISSENLTSRASKQRATELL